MQPMILQSDFGYADGAVCAMYGVAENVCPELRVFDLTHDIPTDILLARGIGILIPLRRDSRFAIIVFRRRNAVLKSFRN